MGGKDEHKRFGSNMHNFDSSYVHWIVCGIQFK